MTEPNSSMGAKPEKRYWHESAQIGDFIYLFGGADDEKSLPRSEIHVFDIRYQTWDLRIADGPNIPPPCAGARCVVIDGCIYSYGGSGCLSDVYCLDPREMKWELVDTSQGLQPKGRWDHCLCAVGSRVIMCGGWPIRDDKLYELKLDEGKKGVWMEVTTTGKGPGGRLCAAMVAIDDHRALLYGGWNGSEFFNDCLVVDLEKKEWTSIEFDQQPSARVYHTLCRLERRGHDGVNFLLIGGEREKDVSDQGYILDLEKRKAHKMESAEPIFLHTAHCVEELNGTIDVILLGGKDPLSNKLKSAMTNLRIGSSNPDFVRIESAVSSAQPSQSVSAEPDKDKAEIIRQLEEENAGLSQRCLYLQAQIAEIRDTRVLSQQMEELRQRMAALKERCAYITQQAAERDRELEDSENGRPSAM